MISAYIAIFLLAWAFGYVLGFKVRMVRTALYAA